MGTTIVALLSGALVVMEPATFPFILFVDLWFLGYHHVISTYTRLAFDPAARREHWLFLYVLPPAILVFVIALAFLIGEWVVASVYLYWQWLHYTRQSWGVQQAYRRKSSELVTENEHLTKAAFYLLPLWGILYRSYQDPALFLGMEVRVIPVPLIVVQIVGAAAVLTSLGWVAQRIMAHRRGAAPKAHSFYMLSHALVFTTGYLVIDDITYGWLVINIWHNAQYVLFVWLFNTKKYRNGITEEAPFLSKISQPKNWWMYFGVCIGIATVVYAGIDYSTSSLATALPITLIVYQSLNFHHYVVDSFIWKLRKPALQKTLDLGTPSA